MGVFDDTHGGHDETIVVMMESTIEYVAAGSKVFDQGSSETP